MENITLTENYVLEFLQSLKIHKAVVPYEMSADILKQLAPIVASMLKVIFNRSTKRKKAVRLGL